MAIVLGLITTQMRLLCDMEYNKFNILFNFLKFRNLSLPLICFSFVPVKTNLFFNSYELYLYFHIYFIYIFSKLAKLINRYFFTKH